MEPLLCPLPAVVGPHPNYNFLGLYLWLCGKGKVFPLMTQLVITAAATETLGLEDAISKDLKSPNGFDGEEKTSCKSLPKV